jgi:hypothetical protein
MLTNLMLSDCIRISYTMYAGTYIETKVAIKNFVSRSISIRLSYYFLNNKKLLQNLKT